MNNIYNNPKEEKKSNPSGFIQSKEYSLIMNDLLYRLIISHNTEEIFFQVEQKDESLLYYYSNKYNYKDIVSILKLPLEIYNEPIKAIEVLNKAYENKKIILKFDENNTNILIVIKLSLGFEEIECPIMVKKIYFDLNGKFNVILKELNSLKKNKKKVLMDKELLEIEKKIFSLKESVEEHLNKQQSTINSLLAKISKNSEQLKSNKNEIQTLKNEISNIKGEVVKFEQAFGVNIHKKKIHFKNKKSAEIKEPIQLSKPIYQDIAYDIKKLEQEEKEEFVFSIILDGSQKVGKTSIIEKFIDNQNQISKNDNPSFGYKIENKYIKINDSVIKLEITDFTISDITRRSANNYKNGDIIMFIYSIDNNISLEKALNKISSLKSKSNQIYFLIGNKSDIENKKVSKKEIEKAISKYNINFHMEVSAKTGSNIDNIFFEGVKILYKNRKPVSNNTAKVVELAKGDEGKRKEGRLKFLFPA